MGHFQFLPNGFLIERDAKTVQTCHKLLFYHDSIIMAGILLASSIELILPTVMPLSFSDRNTEEVYMPPVSYSNTKS